MKNLDFFNQSGSNLTAFMNSTTEFDHSLFNETDKFNSTLYNKTETLVSENEAPIFDVDTTTPVVFDESNIQFEIKNYTVVSHNESVPNVYLLRIRIKGYKWNNQFSDIKSIESQKLLKEKILPLLYKKLNLVPDEINEVKLLKLFRGKRRSSLEMKKSDEDNSDDDDFDDGDLELQFKITESNRITDNIHSNATEVLDKPIFALFYPVKIVAISDPFNFEYLNNTLEQALKQAILMHFAGRMKHCDVKTVSSSEYENSSKPTYPINMRLELESLVELFTEDVDNALIHFAANKNQCELDDQNKTVNCLDKRKEPSSLLRVSDFWIKLENDEPRQNKLMSLSDLFEFNSAWVFGLVIIACILALFFIGCIFAICYTRKPYRRSGKVYHIDSTNKVSYNHQKPCMYPTTKQHIIPKHKEVYY